MAMHQWLSVALFYSEIKTLNMTPNYHKILDNAVKLHQKGTVWFTRHDFKLLFNDVSEGMRARLADLFDAQFLIGKPQKEKAVSPHDRETNVWRLDPRVLDGDREPVPYHITTERSNRALVADRDEVVRLLTIFRQHLDQPKYKKGAAALSRLEEAMKAEILRRMIKDKPIRPDRNGVVHYQGTLTWAALGTHPFDHLVGLVGMPGPLPKPPK